jgi:hypothetical protein
MRKAESGVGACASGLFVRPVEPGAGEQPHGAAVEKRMHAVAVELDFVQPVGAVRRLVDKLREQFAVEIGLPGADRCHGVGDRRIDPAAA